MAEKYKGNTVLAVEPSSFLKNLPPFSNVFDLNSKTLENSIQALVQWKEENFDDDSTENTWLGCPGNVTLAVSLLWAEFFECDLAMFSIRKETSFLENLEQFIASIQAFMLNQNIERTKPLASTKKQRAKRRADEKNVPYLYDVRFVEKNSSLVIGESQSGRTLVVTFDFFQEAFSLLYQLKIAGFWAKSFFLQMCASGKDIDGLILTQFNAVVQKCLKDEIILEPLCSACKKAAKQNSSVSLEFEDKSLVLFQRSVETLEKIMSANSSRVGLFYESMLWYMFWVFLPQVKKAGYSSLIRKAILAMEEFAKLEKTSSSLLFEEELAKAEELQKQYEIEVISLDEIEKAPFPKVSSDFNRKEEKSNTQKFPNPPIFEFEGQFHQGDLIPTDLLNVSSDFQKTKSKKKKFVQKQKK